MSVIETLEAMEAGFIHAGELAPLLGMHKDKLYAKTKNGEVPHFRVLGRVKYDPKVIANWLKQREVC